MTFAFIFSYTCGKKHMTIAIPYSITFAGRSNYLIYVLQHRIWKIHFCLSFNMFVSFTPSTNILQIQWYQFKMRYVFLYEFLPYIFFKLTYFQAFMSPFRNMQRKYSGWNAKIRPAFSFGSSTSLQTKQHLKHTVIFRRKHDVKYI